MKRISSFLSALIFLLAGCGEERDIVARVGEVEISKVDFTTFVAQLAPGLRSSKEGVAADREHLQSMIDEELMFIEASERGVDTSAAVVHKLRELVRQRLVERYRAQVILPRASVDGEDIKRAFVEMDFNRERLLSRILVRNRADLQEVGRGLNSGEDFTALAARFAANDLFAKQGDGVVDWVGRTQAERRFGIPFEVFSGLPLGQVAEPVQLAGGWQIFRFTEERETALANYFEEVDEFVRRERIRASEEEEFEALRHRYDVRLDQQGVDILFGRSGNTLTEDELHQTLYAYSGGVISVAEGLGALQAAGIQDVQRDSALVVDRIARLLLPVRLFAAEAQKRGWPEEADFSQWRERKRRQLILDQLFKEATAEAAPDEDEIKAHYEAHKDRYRTQEVVFVHELWTAEEENARILREEWESGAEIADLLDRPGVRSHAGVGGHGVGEHGWEMRLLRLYKPRYPELVEAAFAAEPGELVGPLESSSGFAVFRVLRREGGEIQPFAEARQRVVASLRGRRENEQIGAYIRNLQQKHSDRVAVFLD